MQVRNFTFRIFLSIFSLIILIGQINAQKFQKGSIILENDEVVEGLIQDNDLSIFTRLIAFKQGKKATKIQVLNPQDIKGFVTENGSKYKAIAVDFEFQTKGGIVHQYKGERFLRVLKEGKINIYELRDIDARAWFIQKEGQPAQLLTLNRKLNDANVQFMIEKIADCGCIDYDSSLPTKINDVVATVAEYNEFVDSPLHGAAAALANDTKMKKP